MTFPLLPRHSEKVELCICCCLQVDEATFNERMKMWRKFMEGIGELRTRFTEGWSNADKGFRRFHAKMLFKALKMGRNGLVGHASPTGVQYSDHFFRSLP
jgi:hypothetical protein